MAEITLKYDDNNENAKILIKKLLRSGFFKKAECNCYSSAFVAKVKKSEKEIEEGKITKVNTDDLWNSI